MSVLLVAPGGVDPRVGNVGLDLALEEGLDAVGEGNAFRVAPLGVRLGLALGVAADGGRLVALGQGGKDGPRRWGRKFDSRLARGHFERRLEGGPVLVERGWQRVEQRANRLLQLAPRGLLLGARRALLLRLDQRQERALALQALDAFGARLEIQAQGALDGDLAEAEVGGGEDLADDDVFLGAV